MRRRVIAAIVVVLIVCLVLFALSRGHAAPDGQPPLAELAASTFPELENAFNAAAHETRVLLLLSPT
ncbi:MAG TPA: hypothetical protein VMZ52_10195 [Bryobacteraceae bacterium]|nr:hypothetical protein [Bryobacteraceae bacterium]